MLTKVEAKQLKANQSRFAIVASLYNSRYVDAMLRAARAELKRAGALSVHVVRVPGAYEIPVVAATLAGQTPKTNSSKLDAILCLGVILRGQTTHAAHIGEAVSQALMQIQIQHQVPVIHEVLLLENEDQARVRCMGTKHNRGTEAAQTAIRMAEVMRALRS